MKRILTTENKQKLCEMAKRSAGNTYDFSEQEAKLAADAKAERMFADELAAQIKNDRTRVSVCGNIIYIERESGERYAIGINKIIIFPV